MSQYSLLEVWSWLMIMVVNLLLHVESFEVVHVGGCV